MQQPINRKEHWNHVYQTKAHDDVSWYQSRPATSLKLIEACGVGKQEGSVATLQVARDSWPHAPPGLFGLRFIQVAAI